MSNDSTDVQRRTVLQIAAGLAAAGPMAIHSATAAATPPAPTGKPGDFDFLSGHWKIKNRQLKQGAWDQFDSEATVFGILGGVASVEELRVSPRGLKWLGNGRTRVVALAESASERSDRADWREVRVPIESIEHGARQLLSLGAEVEVIEPAALRAAVLKQARGVLALYPRAAR